MATRPEFVTFDVDGAALGALHWPGIDGAPTVVAVHGITANAWAWDPIAHHLAGGADLVAVDLRGRGRSHTSGGPFGIRRHADDVAAIIEQLGGPVVVAGHSMGAYVALMAAERHPALVKDLVLVDGGAPLELPDDADVDEVLEATLGPAIERLGKLWVDRTSYYSMWSAHPAFADGISVDLERNLLADLVEVDGGFRTAVDVDAVRHDGRELFADIEVRSLLETHPAPVTIIRAPHGLLGTPPPLISDDVVARHTRHRWVEVPDTNHYTVLLGPRGGPVVADHVRIAIAS
ncbi:MAG: alpha/beta fold hydrolase [Ilumatobacter sp.]|nr:alpha/beta fold hydrolase [Ilumatobacter sp.]